MPPRGGELRWVRPPRQARSRETLDRILDAALDISGMDRAFFF